jgi:4-hydroxy-3-polyprenylbenzoate decarboxylase
MHPLVRWQFRGGIAGDRKAFLFTNVVDARGAVRYPGAILPGLPQPRDLSHRAGCPFEEMDERWARNLNSRSAALVEHAPCHEIVVTGALDSRATARRHPAADLDAGLGHRALRDAVIHHPRPDTGVQNVGNYRGQ